MSNGWICKLNLTPRQTFMLWEALNQTWFSNAEDDQLELLRILRDQLMKHGGKENPELMDKTDEILSGHWMEHRESYMDQGLTKKGFYAVKNKKRDEIQLNAGGQNA